MNTAKPKIIKIAGFLFVLVFLVVSFFSSSLNFSTHAATLPFNLGQEAEDQELPHAVAGSENYRQNFAGLVGSLLSIVMPVSALILLLYLIWGAIEWLTSGGDKGKLEKARGRITTGVIGIVVVSATISLFMLMQQILNVCVLDFWGTCSGVSQVGEACTPGETLCSGNTVMECKSDGTGYVGYECSSGEICSAGACILDPVE